MKIEPFSMAKYKMGVGYPYFNGKVQSVELFKIGEEILAIKRGVAIGRWDIEGNPTDGSSSPLRLSLKKTVIYGRTDRFVAFLIKDAFQIDGLKEFLGPTFRVNYDKSTDMLAVRQMKQMNVISKTEVPLRGNTFAFVKKYISNEFVASMTEAMFKRNYSEIEIV